jgi:hypothetical protein
MNATSIGNALKNSVSRPSNSTSSTSGSVAASLTRPPSARGDVAVEVGDHTLGEVVGLEPVLDRELLDRRDQAVVATDDPFQQAFVTQVVQTTHLAVALPTGIDQRQVARRALREKALFEGDEELVRRAVATVTRGGQRVAILDQRDGVLGRDDLAKRHGASRARFTPGDLLSPSPAMPADHAWMRDSLHSMDRSRPREMPEACTQA